MTAKRRSMERRALGPWSPDLGINGKYLCTTVDVLVAQLNQGYQITHCRMILE